MAVDVATGQHIPGTMEPGVVGGQVEACPRIPVKKLFNEKMKLLPVKYMEALEQNQKIASCCRHPENHEVAAFKSKPEEQVDIYKFYCTCGRVHTRFCCGDDPRPTWTRK